MYGGSCRASIVVPENFPYALRPAPDHDPLSRPLDDALNVTDDFLRMNPSWIAVLSVPRRLPGADTAEQMASRLGWQEVSADDMTHVHTMMELSLGEWADNDPQRIIMLTKPKPKDLAA
jgi:hypothetical protein